MKTIKRTSLPEVINYNKKTYKVDVALSSLYGIGIKINIPSDAIKVEVLSQNLRGKTDLHGVPYKPTTFIYTPVKPSNNKQP